MAGWWRTQGSAARVIVHVLCGLAASDILPADENVGRSSKAPAIQIVTAVAARYQSATDYVLQVRTESKVSRDPTLDSKLQLKLAASRPSRQMVWKRATAPANFEHSLVVSGQSGMGYSRRSKQYVSFGPDSELWNELRAIHLRYFGRFAMLDRLNADFGIAGHDSLRSGGRRIECVRILVQPRNESWAETLWIDTERALVLKSVLRSKRPAPAIGEVVTSVDWTDCRVDEEIDPELFTIAPPAGARRSNTLAWQ